MCIYTVNPKKVVQAKHAIIYKYRSRGYCNICVNTNMILPCVLIAHSTD